LFGQDSNGTVWSICNMNMILHNITRFTIENGDTLEDPLILQNGQIRKFDRVLANPPFSQNYSRANMKFAGRFREWAPETGKKADLMFVQHMLASLKPRGHMATIMPHGVLFRGGKEKLIREVLINDDVIEAIISLPPRLFYGTGIPACVLVCNRNKPETLQGKVLFVNADREYAEDKNQNRLRPEDIEKIDFVFTNKRELSKYSRLVDNSEIIGSHDYNLNIRRYVDNTPDAEPEDVQAHLIGGIPESEVAARDADFAKFDVDRKTLFQPDRLGYLSFRGGIRSKSDIKTVLETDPGLQKIVLAHEEILKAWWTVARDSFAQLRDEKILPVVRHELLATLKDQLVPLGVLDEFKSAGVFVNWWHYIRYDLKTVVSTGWHHSLIPDEYLIAEFFSAEAEEIEVLEAKISELQEELNEAVQAAQEVAAYEPDEDEAVTATVIKKALKELIDDLKESSGASAAKELEALIVQDRSIKAIESRLKDAKATLKQKAADLENRLQLKRIGADDFRTANQDLINQIDIRLVDLDPSDKVGNRTIAALNRDKAALETRIAKTAAVLVEINGELSEAEAQRIILTKLYEIARVELVRYLTAEKRLLVQGMENLWVKYAISSKRIESDREEVLKALSDYLATLGYVQ
jgi:type I restriction enzyme M protein